MNDSRRHSSSLFSTPVSDIIEKHPFLKKATQDIRRLYFPHQYLDIIEKHPFKRNLFQSLFPDYDNAEMDRITK